MKTILLISSLFTVTLAQGCKPAPEKPALQPAEVTARQTESVQADAKSAAVPERDFNFGQKTEFVMAMRTQFESLTQGIDELSVSIDKSSEAVQSEARPQLAELREKASQFDRQLTEVTNSTLPTWNVMKSDAEKAFATLKEKLEILRQGVKNKVAP